MSSPESPLTASELAELEATLLPALERHHLRLLAHGLRTLQAIATTQKSPAPLDRLMLERWALEQEPVAGDQAFASALAHQLEGAQQQLETIGRQVGKPALSLALADLTAWATASANARLAIIEGPGPTSP